MAAPSLGQNVEWMGCAPCTLATIVVLDGELSASQGTLESLPSGFLTYHCSVSLLAPQVTHSGLLQVALQESLPSFISDSHRKKSVMSL